MAESQWMQWMQQWMFSAEVSTSVPFSSGRSGGFGKDGSSS